ncbi:hypothetical protein H9Q69_000098 [Fusarium xylarioides]|nr:hypothetical protein H9Q69_000098 [Fusarium xylarioides]
MAINSTFNYALLIGCPRDLKGTATDIESMRSLLSDPAFGFHTHICSGVMSTRDEIIRQLEALVAWVQALKEDEKSIAKVVIFYSGHGGFIEQSAEDKSRRYQYFVPEDYDKGAVILDVELSGFLKRLTDLIDNVTVILDCCHSGRMARIERHPEMKARRVEPISISKLNDHVRKLVSDSAQLADTYLEGNPKRVCIMSAAPTEVSWEFKGPDGKVGGVMTRNLTKALRAAAGLGQSWDTVMKRVIHMVTTEEPSQHPRVEGASTRVIFSTQHKSSMSHLIKMEGGDPVIQAGRVFGVREKNTYTVMPLNFDTLIVQHSIGEVEVIAVQGFKALCRFIGEYQNKTIPSDGALVFLRKEANQTLIAEYPEDKQEILKSLEDCKFLRPRGKVMFRPRQSAREPTTKHEVAFATHEVALSQLELALVNHELTLTNGGREAMPLKA